MASTTIDLDTELSAVNAILGAIGQAPVTNLGNVVDATGQEIQGVSAYDNPEIAFIYNLLRDANVDVQAEGWHFNTEKHVAFGPDANKKIPIGTDIIRMDVTNGWSSRKYNVVRRNGFLYDKLDHTDEWDGEVLLDVVRLYSFEDLPLPFRRFITYRASRMAATQLVANPQLVQLLGVQEQQARAGLMEYECNQGNHSMFGFPEDSTYQTYQPWTTLGGR
jgi:hypothetical protein